MRGLTHSRKKKKKKKKRTSKLHFVWRTLRNVTEWVDAMPTKKRALVGVGVVLTLLFLMLVASAPPPSTNTTNPLEAGQGIVYDDDGAQRPSYSRHRLQHESNLRR